jgi:hypothetical protein
MGRVGFIWPRDPLPVGKWGFGRRLKDVLQGKGPDIFIGDIDTPFIRPTRGRWSRWPDIYGDPGAHHALPPILPFTDRGEKRYDFRKRRYRVPRHNTWSYVAYQTIDDPNWQSQKAFVVWDTFGNAYPLHPWENTFLGNHHDDFNDGNNIF